MRKTGSAKIAVMAAMLLAMSPALAEDASVDEYRDDRSTGTALITSLYNAINRQEYLRAWSYFAHAADAKDPRADYEEFASGYSDTQSVELLTGPETSEGAAGSTYFTVPVAIDAVSSDGAHSQFAGCYTLRLAQPTVQATPPFQPLHIESAHLEPAEGALEDILPTSCEPE